MIQAYETPHCCTQWECVPYDWKVCRHHNYRNPYDLGRMSIDNNEWPVYLKEERLLLIVNGRYQQTNHTLIKSIRSQFVLKDLPLKLMIINKGIVLATELLILLALWTVRQWCYLNLLQIRKINKIAGISLWMKALVRFCCCWLSVFRKSCQNKPGLFVNQGAWLHQFKWMSIIQGQ